MQQILVLILLILIGLSYTTPSLSIPYAKAASSASEKAGAAVVNERIAIFRSALLRLTHDVTSSHGLPHTPEVPLYTQVCWSDHKPQPASTTPLQPPPGYTPHPPIYIRNDTDLQQQAATEGWSGDGTSTNPYVISGYAINASQTTEGAAAIHIEDVSLCVCIQNCYLYSGKQSYRCGLYLYNTTRITITNCLAVDNSYGFLLDHSSSCTLVNCSASSNYCGFMLWSSGRCTFSNCTTFGNYWEGFALECSSDCTLINCTALNNSWNGFWLDYSNNCAFFNCTASNNRWNGFVLYHSSLCVLYNCTAVANCWDGIWLYYGDDCTLLSCATVANGLDGFWLCYSSNCAFSNCTATNSYVGFALYSVSSCTFANCAVTANYWDGFWLDYSSNCTLHNCTATANQWSGFYICNSMFCVLEGCNAVENRWNYYLAGRGIVDYASHRVCNCSSEGKPVLYSVNQTITDITPTAYGAIILVNCVLSNTLSYIQLPEGGTLELAYVASATIVHARASGVLFHYTTNTAIAHTNTHSGVYGFWLYYSDNCMFFNCTTTNNYCGFWLYCSDSNTLLNCASSTNDWDGFWLYYSSNCTLHNCTASANDLSGFHLDYGDNCTFISCTAVSNEEGFYGYQSGYCSVVGCWIQNSTVMGMNLTRCRNFTIYNNFFNNTANICVHNCCDLYFNTTAYTLGPNIIGGPYLGGNYWNDYTGADMNNDGYGDTPYPITDTYSGNVFYDYLPLVPPPLTITLEEPQEGCIYTYASITIRWTYTNSSAPIDHFELLIYNQTWDTGWVNVGTATNYTIELAEGHYTVNVTAYDTAGRTAFDAVSFAIDFKPPTVQILEPEDGAVLNTTSVTIRWKGSDTVSGIANYSIRIYNSTWDTGWIDRGHDTEYSAILAPSNYTVIVRATDYAGHSGTAVISFAVQVPGEKQQPPLPSLSAGLSTSVILVVSIVVAVAAALVVLVYRRHRLQKD